MNIETTSFAIEEEIFSLAVVNNADAGVMEEVKARVGDVDCVVFSKVNPEGHITHNLHVQDGVSVSAIALLAVNAKEKDSISLRGTPSSATVTTNATIYELLEDFIVE